MGKKKDFIKIGWSKNIFKNRRVEGIIKNSRSKEL